MRSNVRTNVEFVAQIVVAVAVVVTAGLLIKRTIFPGRAATSNLQRIRVGEHLNGPIDWAHNEKSLVFFLKKDCPYCTASAPFYRELIAEASKRNVKCSAVLPDSEKDATKYLRYLELPIADVRIAPLSNYKISGTPTVLFVDRAGTVRSAWFGAQAEREEDMRDELLKLFESAN